MIPAVGGMVGAPWEVGIPVDVCMGTLGCPWELVSGPLRLELRLELSEFGAVPVGVTEVVELVNFAAFLSSSSSPITLSTAAFNKLPNHPDDEEDAVPVW